MTLCAAQFRRSVDVDYERHLVSTLDGGCVALDVVRTAGSVQAPDADSHFALLVSGLGGGSQDGYVRNMAGSLLRNGFRVAVLNMRGCGRSPLKTPRLFSAYRGSTDDVRVAVRYVRENLLQRKVPSQEKYDSPRVVLVGWSNGATIIVNTLAEQTTQTGKGHAGNLSMVDAGAALATPHDMPKSIGELEQRPFSKFVYNRAVTQSLVRQFEPYAHLFRAGPVSRWSDDKKVVRVDVDAVLKATIIRTADDEYTRKVFEYNTVHDYYSDASSYQRLGSVRVPLLYISAAGDPMATNWVPVEQVRRNPFVMLAYTAHGGHLGWLDQDNWAEDLWVQRAVGDFFSAVVQQTFQS